MRDEARIAANVANASC